MTILSPTVAQRRRHVTGHSAAAERILEVFETHLTADAARVALITGLDGASVRAALLRLNRQGFISRGPVGKEGQPTLYFMTRAQRAAL